MVQRWRAAQALARDLDAALALERRGRLAEAAAVYRGVLEREPGHVRALFNFGLIRVRQAALDEAIGLLAVVVERRPDFAEAHNALGIALRLCDRHEEALAEYAKALAIKPDYAEVETNIGLALQAQGRAAEAIGHYQRALALKPDYAEAESNLGAALRELYRFEEAAAHYHRAVALRPDAAGACSNLGAALQLIGRHDEALARFDQALAMTPGLAEAHHGRGTALRTLGRLDEARGELEQAIALAPRKAEFYRSLAEMKRFTRDEPHLAAAEALARETAALSPQERIHLCFALGKIYDDLGEHERAFAHLVEANALKRECTLYNETAVLGQLDRTRELFSTEVMRERAGQGEPSPLPVFIIGMPRSGTTLVEQVLASHPNIHGGGELSDFANSVAALGSPAGVPPDIGGEELRRIGGRYLERLAALAPSALRITDKMPANFRFAGLIHLALPNARLVHVSRDPVDTCLSCFSILFGGDQPFTYDLAELGRYYHAYRQLMAHWRTVLPPGVMLEVRYEALVGDFEREAQRLVAHCGLEWNEACLDFHKTQRPVHTASSVQVRQPLYQSSVRRWRPPPDQLAPLLQGLTGA